MILEFQATSLVCYLWVNWSKRNKIARENSRFYMSVKLSLSGFLLEMLSLSVFEITSNVQNWNGQYILAEYWGLSEPTQYLSRLFLARCTFCHFSPRFRTILVIWKIEGQEVATKWHSNLVSRIFGLPWKQGRRYPREHRFILVEKYISAESRNWQSTFLSNVVSEIAMSFSNEFALTLRISLNKFLIFSSSQFSRKNIISLTVLPLCTNVLTESIF